MTNKLATIWANHSNCHSSNIFNCHFDAHDHINKSRVKVLSYLVDVNIWKLLWFFFCIRESLLVSPSLWRIFSFQSVLLKAVKKSLFMVLQAFRQNQSTGTARRKYKKRKKNSVIRAVYKIHWMCPMLHFTGRDIVKIMATNKNRIHTIGKLSTKA